MTPVEARAYIIAQLVELFADEERKPDIQPHRGQFQSIDEIKNIAVRPPTVLVSYRSFSNVVREHGEMQCDVLWALYVIATDTRAERRNELATGVAVAVSDHIAATGNAWAFAQDIAKNLSAADMSTLALDVNGVALWQITWQQTCRFTIKDLTGLIGEFLGFDADHKTPGASPSDPPKAQTSATY